MLSRDVFCQQFAELWLEMVSSFTLSHLEVQRLTSRESLLLFKIQSLF